jgi:hypothetical protein
LALETVSLKAYFALLETVKPANATNFSIEGGTIEMPVVVHKSITVSMKVD